MFFSRLNPRQRYDLLSQPFPDEWVNYLEKNVPDYCCLSSDEQAKLEDDLRVFIAEKHWEGCGGLQLSDEIKVTIAGHACLMVLGLDVDHFWRVITILVYPSGFDIAPKVDELGHPYSDVEPLAGQAHHRGVVVLAWDDVLFSGQHPGKGYNLVIHEFAHELDRLNGEMDGTPLLQPDEMYDRWYEVMTREHRRLIRAADKGRATLLDKYGTIDEAEFFAVATECFFDRPVDMARRHRKLYDLLRDYYGQDPAARRGHREPAPDVQED